MPGNFTTHPIFLSGLLGDLRSGKLQLPDFQRGWVWDDDRIRGVLASVSRDFPIGAVMLLKTGGPTRFKPRTVEGVPAPTEHEPEHLILDGQQRLTSLFQATIFGGAVGTTNTKRQPIRRWYYIDMHKALESPADREDAVISVPESRKRETIGGQVELDVTSPEKEYEAMMFPCSALFDPSSWRRDFGKFWGYAEEKIRLFDRFEAELIQRFKQHQIPVITLTEEVPKEAVCHVFEKVNTGGVVLTAFDLLTATYAADNFPLREDWFGPASVEAVGIHHVLRKHKVLEGVQNTDFLQAVTLLHTYEVQRKFLRNAGARDAAPAVSCKRSAVLDLPLDNYKALRRQVLEGFLAAGKFAREQNIFRARDLPYQTQLVPLAAILASLGGAWEGYGIKQKLQRWLWSGVLGELYGGAVESRFARDVPEVLAWIEGGAEPSTVTDATFNPNRLMTLRTRNSAAYKGIYALLMNHGGMDFRTLKPITAQVFEDESIDIHHIFPQKWCREAVPRAIDRGRMESIVNKTAISASTNRIIGGRAPTKYLDLLQRKFQISPGKVDNVLETHAIDPTALRADDFDRFFEARRLKLLALIAAAMGKPVAGAIAEPEPIEESDEDDDIGETEETAAA